MSEANTHQLPYTDSQLNIAFGKMINFEPSLSSTSTDFVTSDGVNSNLGTYGFSNFTGNFFNTNYLSDTSSDIRVLTVQAIVNGLVVTNSEIDTWWNLPYGGSPHIVEVQHGLGKIPSNIHWGFTNYANFNGYPSGGARIEPSNGSVTNAMIWADTDKAYWKMLPSADSSKSLYITENNPTIVSNGTADGSPYRGSFELTYDYLGGSPTITKVFQWSHSQSQWNGISSGAFGERFIFDPTVGSNGRWKIFYAGSNYLTAANDADEPWQVTQWTGSGGNTNVWLQNPSYDTTNVTTFGQAYPIIRNTFTKLQIIVEA